MKMKIPALTLTAIALSSPIASAQVAEAPSGSLVIRDVTVISPERTAPLEHAYVLVRDGRIAEVGTRVLTAGRTIDGAGRFLVPGLIDSHVHLADVPGMLPAHEREHPEIAAVARAQQPRSYLYFGFTTVVDRFGTPDRIARWNEAEIRPDAYFCGGAPIANGYPMNFMPEDLRFRMMPYFLYDARQRERIPASIDPEAHTPEAVVERMAADGAICVKTAYEPGFGGVHDLPTPTLETIRALVEAAHARSLPVLIHANSKAAQEFAVAAGVDIIAHGMWNGLDGEMLPGDVDALLRTIAEGGIGYEPTFQVLHGEVDLFDEDFLDDPMLSDAYPAALIEWYRTPEAGWFRDQIAGSLGDLEPGTAYAPLFRRLGRVVRVLAGRGARLLFGSDTPSAPTYANPPGLNGLWEMHRWIDAGVSEERLFRALTIENARAFGLDDAIGTIEPGKTANLLLLRENPLDSVDAYDTIETVILAGRPIERGRLSARRAAGS
ncbi:MAG TPA: amidohydrolase family protein [Longimicrobiales bacterium]